MASESRNGLLAVIGLLVAIQTAALCVGLYVACLGAGDAAVKRYQAEAADAARQADLERRFYAGESGIFWSGAGYVQVPPRPRVRALRPAISDRVP